MCKTYMLTYSCKHSISWRPSTCRGNFVYHSRTKHKKSGDGDTFCEKADHTTPSCRSTTILQLHSKSQCGRCMRIKLGAELDARIAARLEPTLSDIQSNPWGIQSPESEEDFAEAVEDYRYRQWCLISKAYPDFNARKALPRLQAKPQGSESGKRTTSLLQFEMDPNEIVDEAEQIKRAQDAFCAGWKNSSWNTMQLDDTWQEDRGFNPLFDKKRDRSAYGSADDNIHTAETEWSWSTAAETTSVDDCATQNLEEDGPPSPCSSGPPEDRVKSCSATEGQDAGEYPNDNLSNNAEYPDLEPSADEDEADDQDEDEHQECTPDFQYTFSPSDEPYSSSEENEWMPLDRYPRCVKSQEPFPSLDVNEWTTLDRNHRCVKSQEPFPSLKENEWTTLDRNHRCVKSQEPFPSLDVNEWTTLDRNHRCVKSQGADPLTFDYDMHDGKRLRSSKGACIRYSSGHHEGS